MGNGDSKGATIKEGKKCPEPELKSVTPTTTGTEEGTGTGTGKGTGVATPTEKGDSFEVILSPARSERRMPLSPRQTPSTPTSRAELDARLEAAAERRRSLQLKSVAKAERLEKGPSPSKRAKEATKEEKAAALNAAMQEAAAKRDAHLNDVKEKAKACASPKRPNANPASP